MLKEAKYTLLSNVNCCQELLLYELTSLCSFPVLYFCQKF